MSSLSNKMTMQISQIERENRALKSKLIISGSTLNTVTSESEVTTFVVPSSSQAVYGTITFKPDNPDGVSLNDIWATAALDANFNIILNDYKHQGGTQFLTEVQNYNVDGSIVLKYIATTSMGAPNLRMYVKTASSGAKSGKFTMTVNV